MKGFILLGLLALTLAACGSEQPTETHTVRGIYEGTRFDGTAVRVNHEEIPEVMAAMRMDIVLADTADVSHLEPGGKVSFHLAVFSTGFRAYGFTPLPDDTELHLIDTEAEETVVEPQMDED